MKAEKSHSSPIQFLVATQDDLPAILQLLADDHLGKQRERIASEVDPVYLTAFLEISEDQNNELIVGKLNQEVVAVLQVTYIPNLTLRGSKRAQIEGVRVSSKLRGQGIGHQLFQFVIDRASQRGCRLAQLTTNKARPDASRFYESLGFRASHEGFKLEI